MGDSGGSDKGSPKKNFEDLYPFLKELSLFPKFHNVLKKFTHFCSNFTTIMLRGAGSPGNFFAKSVSINS